jgi:hypothetical protein
MKLAMCGLVIVGLAFGDTALRADAPKAKEKKADAEPKTGERKTAEATNEKANADKHYYAYSKDGSLIGTAQTTGKTTSVLATEKMAREAAGASWIDASGKPAAVKCVDPVPSPPNCVICKGGIVLCRGRKVDPALK